MNVPQQLLHEVVDGGLGVGEVVGQLVADRLDVIVEATQVHAARDQRKADLVADQLAQLGFELVDGRA